MKKGFLVAIILIAVLTCALAFAACAEVSTTVTYMVDGEVFKTIVVTGTGQSGPGFTPSKSGYTFGGWYTDTALLTPFDFEAYAANNERGDIVVYGKWEVNTYTATFMVDGNIIEEVRFDADDMYVDEPDVPQRTGYTGEWEDYEIKAENLTINAVYTPITYNITYENTLGAVNTNPATYNIESATITLADITSPGYTFEGWFVGEEKVESIELGSYGDITLTAKWTLTQYTATFVNSDGTVGTVGFDIEDTALSEPAVPQRTGYTGEWEDYEIKAENMTINAVYTPITYNITYENTLGAENGNPATYNIETAITLADITSPGYTFEGWFIGEEKVESIELGSYGDVTLTARWTLTQYTATFVNSDGTVGTVGFDIEDTALSEPAVPLRTGYTGAWEDYEIKAEDLTINAVYTPITYDITYENTKGATNGNPATYNIETAITLSDITSLGYTFEGWYTDETFEEQVDFISEGSFGDLELFAKWTPTEYSVTYVLDGGINAEANPFVYTVETLGGADGVIALEDPSKDKSVDIDISNGVASFTHTTYTFGGWYKDSGFRQRVSELSLSLGNVTLYAKWNEGSETTTEQVYTRSGNYIYFGEYPQTIKAADVTVGDVADEDGYYLGSDGERYAKVVAAPNGSNYTFSDNSSVISGNTYYFKVEPIRWSILSESDGNALILCDSIIANHYYHHTSSSTTIDGQTVYANNYKYSDIRAWLNDEFYKTAFGALQQALIQTTQVDNSVYSTGYSSNPYACENTFDKVFLLSYREVTNSAYGFASSYSTKDTARRMLTSDFSRATGAYMSTDSSYYGNGWWWLRSPDNDSFSYARNVRYLGSADYINYVLYDYRGVVPALNLMLS